MTTNADQIEPSEASRLNAAPAAPEGGEDIVSVNKRGGSDNKAGKAIFVLVIGAVLVGVMAWFSQDWLNARKTQMKASAGPKTAEDTKQVFNPEKTGTSAAPAKLGADSGLPAPSQAAAARPGRSETTKDDSIRGLRGADGKVMVNAQGRAMGVDRDGNVVEVPAIEPLTGDQTGRKPLPGAEQGQGGGQGQPKPPSRYGGALFVGEPGKMAHGNAAGDTGNQVGGPIRADTGSPASGTSRAQTQTQQIAEILRNAGIGGAQTSRTGGTPGAFGGVVGAPVEQGRVGTVGSALHSSATPVALARRMTDQDLILPKGRQADCVLTGRIIDEVPGFTSCVLVQNLYSDNGRVLLLERGSELTGEYGVTNQLGLERMFVTWTRLKTPDGIEIDLSSPGSDRLGTSGIPGHMDNRWGARVGAALLVSFVKDVTVAIINKYGYPDAGATVNLQTMPGQNTVNTGSALAEEVMKQTLKVRPRLTVNEGDRISVYVARDLDFSPVYAIKTAGTVGTTQPLTK